MYPQGRMSHHFREMRVGDYLAVKGPKVLLSFVHLRIMIVASCCVHAFLWNFVCEEKDIALLP